MKRVFFLGLTALAIASCGTQQSMYNSKEPVDIGYGSVQKDNLTQAVSQVKIDENQVNGYSNIYDYIKGKVPGVNVIGSFPNVKIQIRGINSLNLTNDPLFIVDGTEVADIGYIHPNDVKSISVLKDASSSIYGSRGANGVILITTKR